MMNRRCLYRWIVLSAVVGLFLPTLGCVDPDNPKQTGVNVVPAEPPPAPNGMMKVGKKK
jgi:hypothetical protein